MDDKETAEILKFWKDILFMQEWEFVLKYCTAADMPQDTQGSVTWTLGNKTAIIKILRPDNYNYPDFPQDIERTILHEILHCFLAFQDKTKKGSIEEILFEQKIETISKALIKLKRGQQ